MIKREIVKRVLKISDFQVDKLKLMINEEKKALHVDPNDYLDALLVSHSIEKGLSLDKPKKIFGENKAEELLGILERMDKKCFEYDVAMSILDEYIKTRQYKSEKIASIKSRFDELQRLYGYNKIPSGVEYVSRGAILCNENMNFEKFVHGRHDIRKTTKDKIKEEWILKAIKIASMAPSACNRQPWRVYYSMDDKKNRDLGGIVSGNRTFMDDMKYYCAIVLDHKYFANRVDEFRQIYLNAGIFIAYFVLALHYLGIGSCIMQFTGLVEDADVKSRAILKLSDTEQVMAVIGYGKYPKKVKCSKAGRRSIRDIARKF